VPKLHFRIFCFFNIFAFFCSINFQSWEILLLLLLGSFILCVLIALQYVSGPISGPICSINSQSWKIPLLLLLVLLPIQLGKLNIYNKCYSIVQTPILHFLCFLIFMRFFALSIPKAEKYHYYYYLEVLFLCVLIAFQYARGPISAPICSINSKSWEIPLLLLLGRFFMCFNSTYVQTPFLHFLFFLIFLRFFALSIPKAEKYHYY